MLGVNLTSTGPGEPYFTAYAFEAYLYGTDAENKRFYNYMVNQYDYSYDSNATKTISNKQTYNNLNSQKSLIEIDLRDTGVKDYTPLNGLLGLTQTKYKLDVENQKTLDEDCGNGYSRIGQWFIGDYDSSLRTLRVNYGGDFINIVPVIERLQMGVNNSYWSLNTTTEWSCSGFVCSDINILKKIENLKNLRKLNISQLSSIIGNGITNVNLQNTSLVVSQINRRIWDYNLPIYN